TNPAARHLPVIESLTPEIEAMGGEPPPGYSSGGMRTKLLAAGIATRSGCAMAIALGKTLNPLRALMDGAQCSWFLPQPHAHTARKQWIAGSLNPVGEIVVDAGAAKALQHGGSLLPAGVVEVRGAFSQGDLVDVVSASGRILAHGLAAYDAEDARRIAGHQSTEVANILGRSGRDELIHRDDLVVL
ncbi:glutamate 5-kinase, partial [Acetobacter peroxydans]